MKISIVIPVYNGEETLKKCLDSLITQSCSKRNYEVIVINDASTDNTLEILKKIKKRGIKQNLHISIIDFRKNKGRAIARQKGAKKAKYNNLLFIDAISKDVGAKLSLNQNVSYLGGPKNLTDISIEVERLVPKLSLDKKFLFLDSITTLAAYNSVQSVTKFSHFMTSKMRALNLSGIVISMEQNTHPEIYASLAQVCDRIIKL